MCDQAEKQRLYKEIWQRVKGVYCKGFCVSEARSPGGIVHGASKRSCQVIAMSLSNQHGRWLMEEPSLTSS